MNLRELSEEELAQVRLQGDLNSSLRRVNMLGLELESANTELGNLRHTISRQRVELGKERKKNRELTKQLKLEKAGFRTGTVKELLNLSDEDEKAIEERLRRDK